MKYTTMVWTEEVWAKMIDAANATGVATMQNVAIMLSYLWGSLNTVVACRSNAHAVSINSKIRTLKSLALGYRTGSRLRTAQ